MNEVIIRAYQPRDAKQLLAAVRESIESTYPFQDWCHPEYALKDAKQWGREAVKQLTGYHFLVCDEADGHIIGTTSVKNIDWKNHVAEIGYFIRETKRNKGFAVKAVELTIQFVFTMLNLHRIEFYIAIHNYSSIRVAEKIGAQQEAICKDRLTWQDEYFDAVLYAVVKQEVNTLD